MRVVAWVATLLASAAISACSGNAPAPTTLSLPTVVPISSTIATPTANSGPAATRVPTARPVITSTDTITLTVWADEVIAPGTTPAGRILRNQLDAFSASNSNIHIEIIAKKSAGKGGLLDFLTTTRSVMPTRLPDLIAIDLSEVPFAADAGLLQPLETVLPVEATSDFFPFAAKAARSGNHWVAVPFAVDIEHLIYDKTIVRKPPQTWEDFTRQKGSLLVPLGGDDAFLLQYLAQGASLTDAADQTVLDQNATAQALSFFKRAHDTGLVSDAALAIKSVDEVWPTFAAGQVAMAQVSASRYLIERAKLPNALYAAVPTREGRLATLASGWSFALITEDPTRQSASARFIQWIIQGERLGPWLRAAHLLPANRATVILSVDPPDYASFLRDQLDHATALPPASTYSRQSEAWRTAISAVWKGQMTPEEAARTAAAAK